jgi:hypothetical protein
MKESGRKTVYAALETLKMEIRFIKVISSTTRSTDLG